MNMESLQHSEEPQISELVVKPEKLESHPLHGITGVRAIDPETARVLEDMNERLLIGLSVGASFLVGGWIVYENFIKNLPQI